MTRANALGVRSAAACALIALLMAAGSCARSSARPPVVMPPPLPAPPAPPTPPAPVPSGATITSLLVKLPVAQGGEVARLSLEGYVAGVLTGEQAVGSLPSGTASAVLQMQALISRTFAVANLGRHAREGYDLCSTTHCQVYRPLALAQPADALVQGAVAATGGRIVAFDGLPINALYHANCGGATSAPQEIWGGAIRPYLVSRVDPMCAIDARAAWRWRVAKADLRRALNADPITRVGTRMNGISIVDEDATGRITRLALVGELTPMVRGEEFRRVVLAAFGARSLQSLRFTLTTGTDEYVFDGRGLGHGAGLCQAGALSRLRAGASVSDVLAYYYPGAEVRSLDSIARR